MTCANIATVSEQLFVDLCSQKNLACVRIAEGVVPVADFSIKLHELEIFAEVKQLDFNEKDQQIFAAYCAGEVITSMAPTARVREKIANVYRQLKGYSRNGSPCIIVLYNNTGSWNRIDTYTVTTAMFGVFEFCLGLSQIGSALLRGHGFGKNRKLTRNTCRGISAVFVMERSADSRLNVSAYHNPFAVHPICVENMALIADKQFSHTNPHEGQFVQLMPNEIDA